MMKLKWLSWQSQKLIKQKQRGFAMTTLISILIIISGLQVWQLYIFKNQMRTYANIKQNYRLDMMTNEVKIARLNDPDKKKFKINDVLIEIDNDNIIFVISDKSIIKRKFISSEHDQG